MFQDPLYMREDLVFGLLTHMQQKKKQQMPKKT